MTLDELFARTQQEKVPGGCDMCHAYQTMQVVSPGVCMLNVHHDDWCPLVRRSAAETN